MIRSPKFLGSPLRACPALRPRRSRWHQAISVPAMLSSAKFTASTSTTNPISGLNHTAYALAVYASQSRSPSDHARLASGWLAGLSRAGLVTRGTPEKVFSSSHLHQACLAHE